jgi:hypothetical protein
MALERREFVGAYEVGIGPVDAVTNPIQGTFLTCFSFAVLGAQKGIVHDMRSQ